MRCIEMAKQITYFCLFSEIEYIAGCVENKKIVTCQVIAFQKTTTR